MKIKNRISLFSKASNTIRNRYAVILAGGEGTRLKGLTRAIAGDERPKQFCPILNGETLLDITRKRIAAKIPPGKTFFSLTRNHERYFRKMLSDVSQSRLVIQPQNKGTAPAILLSVLRLAEIDPNASVAFFPSDHYFSDDREFMENVETAYGSAERNPDSVILLGIEPDSAETSYGWIEPVDSFFSDVSKSVTRVQRFWEKPTVESAKYLMAGNCLWNSFVMVGRVDAFLNLFRKQLPELFYRFESTVSAIDSKVDDSTIISLYDAIEGSNFSSDILERSAKDLFVLRVGGVAWSDWGEPHRVIGTLENLGLQLDWMRAVVA